MKLKLQLSFIFLMTLVSGCQLPKSSPSIPNAEEVLLKYGGNAFAYGGYRTTSRSVVPTVEEIKEDMLILNAMGCHLIRTYHTQQYGQVSNLLKAIRQLNKEEKDFKMYVMLGAWIQCQGAWTETPNREEEDFTNNRAEIDKAIEFAQQYPEIIRIIAVGNEAMVHWAWGYYVNPNIILQYVEELQELKIQREIDPEIWITSSDNFASWGGGIPEYKTTSLKQLIKAVDYVSLHTYPFHDTHYNYNFWYQELDSNAGDYKNAISAMDNAVKYAQQQYQTTRDYIHEISPGKAVHIGETGWASMDNNYYSAHGSGAADELKQALYYKGVREWTRKSGIACFYFEAFDEPWKDDLHASGSENHFGLITVDGELKYAIWDKLKSAELKVLSRGENLRLSFKGDTTRLYSELLPILNKRIALNK